MKKCQVHQQRKIFVNLKCFKVLLPVNQPAEIHRSSIDCRAP